MTTRHLIILLTAIGIAFPSAQAFAASPYQYGNNKVQQQTKQYKTKKFQNKRTVKNKVVNKASRQAVRVTKPARVQAKHPVRQINKNRIVRKQAQTRPAYRWSKEDKFNLAKLNSVRPYRPSHMDNNRHDHENNRHRPGRHDRHRHNHRHGHHHRHRPHRHGWYNAHYLAPIHIHYHPVGHRLRVLPRSYINIVVGGLPYYYASGVYYRPFNSGYVAVSAPIGAFIRDLPTAAIGFTLGMLTYHFVNNTYYRWDEPRQAYEVVEKPKGAEQAMEKQTSDRLVVYPNENQDQEQQAKDRYECHRWAVSESGIDPTEEDVSHGSDDKNIYRRAIKACLGGRDYTVT